MLARGGGMGSKVAWAGLAAALGATVGCAGDPPAPITADAVRIAGPEVLTGRLVPALTRTWQSHEPGITFDVATTTDTQAFSALIDGSLSFAATTRHPTPAEEERAAA